MAADETMGQEGGSILDQCIAEYAQLMDELFGNGPNAIPVRWVERPSFMYFNGQDYKEEEEVEEELGAVDDGTPAAVSR